MPTYIPGFYDEIAPGLKNFGEILGKIKNPHREFQEGLRNAIATNPQLMQQLVDMEKNNPGFLQSINAGGLAGIAGGMQESFANIQDKDTRKAYTGMTPQQQAEANAKKLGYRDESAVQQDTAQLEATKASTAANIQQTDYYKSQQEKAKLEEAQKAQYRQVAQNALLRIKSPRNLYAAIRSGGLAPDERVAVMSLPEYETDIKFQQDEYWNEQRLQLQRDAEARLHADAKGFNLDELQQKLDSQRAAEVVDRAGNSVSVKDVYQLLANKQLRAEVEKWKKPPTDTPQDMAMFSAMQAIRNNQRQVASTELLTAREKFDKITADQFKVAYSTNYDHAQRLEAVDMINKAAAATFAPLGVEAPVYGFGEEGDKTGSFGKFREHTFYLKSADPRLAEVGIGATETRKPGEKDLSGAAEMFKKNGATPAEVKKLKDGGFTDAEIAKIQQLASGANATTKPRTTSSTPLNPALDRDVDLERTVTGRDPRPSNTKPLDKDTSLVRATTGRASSNGKVDMGKISKFISDYHSTKLTSDKAKLLEDSGLSQEEFAYIRGILRLQ
jgi:hypothetical protein